MCLNDKMLSANVVCIKVQEWLLFTFKKHINLAHTYAARMDCTKFLAIQSTYRGT